MTPERFNLLKQVFQEHNCAPGATLSFDQFNDLTDEIEKRFGEECEVFIRETMFMPFGDPVDPGFEDSCSEYLFDVFSWDEFDDSMNYYF